MSLTYLGLVALVLGCPALPGEKGQSRSDLYDWRGLVKGAGRRAAPPPVLIDAARAEAES